MCRACGVVAGAETTGFVRVCACGGHAKMETQPPRGCGGVSKSILHTEASYYPSPACGARRTHLGAGWQQVGAGELGCTHGWPILWEHTGTVSYPLRAVVCQWGCLADRGSRPLPHVCTQRSQPRYPVSTSLCTTRDRGFQTPSTPAVCRLKRSSSSTTGFQRSLHGWEWFTGTKGHKGSQSGARLGADKCAREGRNDTPLVFHSHCPQQSAIAHGACYQSTHTTSPCIANTAHTSAHIRDN
jgi:hypothetical protein